MKLKQYLLASTVCVLPVAASAADLPMKAPPMRVVQPVPFTWTGFLHRSVRWHYRSKHDGYRLGRCVF